jgi:hypothetical protein
MGLVQRLSAGADKNQKSSQDGRLKEAENRIWLCPKSHSERSMSLREFRVLRVFCEPKRYQISGDWGKLNNDEVLNL